MWVDKETKHLVYGGMRQRQRLFKRLPDIFDTSQIIKVLNFQMAGAIQQIWKIEIVDIVARQYVRIDLSYKIRPFL